MSRGRTMFIYKKLFELMKAKNITKNDLRNNGIISSATIAKLGKNERVSIDVIEALCKYLDCQPGDIMEYVPDEKINGLLNQVSTLQDMLLQLKDGVKAKSNKTDEEVLQLSAEVMKAMEQGKLPDLFMQALQNTEEQ